MTKIALFTRDPRPEHFNRAILAGMGEASAVRKSAPRIYLWDLHPSLHCSVVGTCLTTTELRQILRKAGYAGIEKRSDHDIHSDAVALSGKREAASKLLHKALDRRHRGALDRFGRVKTKEEVQALWREYVEKGEIPAAYWAVLTHTRSDEELIRRVFGEVHMLSHLVGAANRADIRRLSELEQENAMLHEKVYRQQVKLRDEIVTRDAKIRNLRDLLTGAVAAQSASAQSRGTEGDERAAASMLVSDLDRKLRSAAARCGQLESRLEAARVELETEKKNSSNLELQVRELREELNAVESALLPASLPNDGDAPAKHLQGRTLLYVGGRANQLTPLKKLVEDHGAAFLHHDGGLEDHSRTLAALVGRADAVLFPVDCVSHSAADMVKRVCKQLGKAYFPLRSSGLTSFAAAVRHLPQPELKCEA